jgi:hypothetical protein
LRRSVYINVIKQGRSALVACCDSNLLGKTLREKKMRFVVNERLYRGRLVDIDGAIAMLKNATTANLVGSIIIERAIKEGIIHPQAVMTISNVPHAQIVRF